MGLFSLVEFFKCEPFELNFRLHVLGGFWPLETDVKWKQIAISVFSFLSFFSLTSMIIVQAIDVYLLRNDPVQLTKDLCSISVSYTIVFKSLMLLHRIDMVLHLKHKFTEYKNAQRDPVHVEILEKSDQRILLAIRTLYMMAGSCSVFWVLYPGLDSEEGRKVPFPYRLPMEEWTFPVWVGLYVYQSMSILGFLINTISVDGIFCGFVCRINAHYDIIIHNLNKLGALERKTEGEKIGKEEEEVYVRKILKDNVQLHQELLRDVGLFRNLFSPLCFMHFLGMITMTGNAIIVFVRIARNLRLQILQKILYIAVGLWDTFLYCYYASKMKQKSLALSSAFCEIPWYRLSPRIRRDLTFIVFKCQQMPKIKVAHYFYLDLKAFVNVLKISYDVTALLFRTVKE